MSIEGPFETGVTGYWKETGEQMKMTRQRDVFFVRLTAAIDVLVSGMYQNPSDESEQNY